MELYYFYRAWQSWFLPPGINFLLIALGFAFWFYSKRVGGFLMVLGILSIWLLSLPIVAYPLVNLLQNQYPILQAEDLKNTDPRSAIVVLGGGENLVEAEYANKQTISDVTLHRVNYGAYLQQQTQLPVILSGGPIGFSGIKEADLMAQILRDHFKISPEFLEKQSLTTAEESQFLKAILKEKKIDQIYLVTNAWHMPRTVYIFECLGIRVIPAPMGPYVYGPGYALISFFPNMDALYASSVAVHEYLGLFSYKVRYSKLCKRAEV